MELAFEALRGSCIVMPVHRRNYCNCCLHWRYVCEEWEERDGLRVDQGSSSTWVLIQEKSRQILRHILESLYKDIHQLVELSSSTEKHLFEKLLDAYNACMDVGKIKNLGSGPLIEVLHNIDQLFPTEKPQEILETFEELRDRHQKLIYYLTVKINYQIPELT